MLSVESICARKCIRERVHASPRRFASPRTDRFNQHLRHHSVNYRITISTRYSAADYKINSIRSARVVKRPFSLLRRHKNSLTFKFTQNHFKFRVRICYSREIWRVNFLYEMITFSPIVRAFCILGIHFVGEAIYTFRLILRVSHVILNAIVPVALLFITQLQNNLRICEK